MFKIIRHSLSSGVVTNAFPEAVTPVPEGFRGKPVIDFPRCTACARCADACPTGAIDVAPGKKGGKAVTLDYGRCIFCGECEAACPDAITLGDEFLLASAERSALSVRALYAGNEHEGYRFEGIAAASPAKEKPLDMLGREVERKIRATFGRSLHIREVDAGSCNGCEVEITSLNNPVYDLERFGMHFVASPRHADMLLVTGPVTRNMEAALKQTYEATPHPKLVVAVGACAVSGGIFGRSYASCGGVDAVVPVDVYIPGCPPRPEAILHGIMLAIDRLPSKI